ncbi:MAG: thioesterase [Rhodobacterales bacterium]|nr:MAG: thioesterase [Rhodobacterales bacterium]
MDMKMTRAELSAFMVEQFDQVADDFAIEALRPMGITMRKRVQYKHLRPGGTVSGPAMFALADISVYLAIMAMVGPRAMAVTTNCSIDFMRKPAADADLIADCQLHKLGRVLAVGDVLIRSEGQAAPVARATLTYSLPPERGQTAG